MSTESKVKEPDAAEVNGQPPKHEAIVRDHHITLKASLQNAQEQKARHLEQMKLHEAQYQQWLGAEAILQNLLKDLEGRVDA